MAQASRDRVGVDLRGIGDAVRAAARARHVTLFRVEDMTKHWLHGSDNRPLNPWRLK